MDALPTVALFAAFAGFALAFFVEAAFVLDFALAVFVDFFSAIMCSVVKALRPSLRAPHKWGPHFLMAPKCYCLY